MKTESVTAMQQPNIIPGLGVGPYLRGDKGQGRDGAAGGRAAEPEEVADLIMFLSSGRAALISGTVVTIDGRRHRRARFGD